MKYEMELHKTDPAGCRKRARKQSRGDCPHKNEACRKPAFFFLLQDSFFSAFFFFLNFSFMFKKVGKTKAPRLRISTRDPLKQIVANLPLYPAP